LYQAHKVTRSKSGARKNVAHIWELQTPDFKPQNVDKTGQFVRPLNTAIGKRRVRARNITDRHGAQMRTVLVKKAQHIDSPARTQHETAMQAALYPG
jgi:hypothetical protein